MRQFATNVLLTRWIVKVPRWMNVLLGIVSCSEVYRSAAKSCIWCILYDDENAFYTRRECSTYLQSAQFAPRMLLIFELQLIAQSSLVKHLICLENWSPVSSSRGWNTTVQCANKASWWVSYQIQTSDASRSFLFHLDFILTTNTSALLGFMNQL